MFVTKKSAEVVHVDNKNHTPSTNLDPGSAENGPEKITSKSSNGLLSEWIESTENEVYLHSIDESTLLSIQCYMHTGTTRINEATVLSLLNAASILIIDPLCDR